MSLSLFDSRKKEKIEFAPLRGNTVSFYSCGPTVYNRVHIGNIRAFLFADLLQRYLRFGKKYEVQWVMNITDVDDKTIRDSKNTFPDIDPKEALEKFTRKYEGLFFQDLEKVGVKKSHFLKNPRATDYIPQMQDLIQKIYKNGYAYEKDGSIYFDVKKYHTDQKYGHFVEINFDEMQSTSRVENDEYEKESVADFVLWKSKKKGEPFWDFDFNGQNLAGRPGWHLECSAMEAEIFDLPFDIHSGGVDLCFPHHEDEIAQSTAGYKCDPTNFWVHNEHLMVDGKKMSKSLGNFYTLEDLEEKGFSPEVVRFFLVTGHYRTKINLSDDSLKSSGKLLQRIRNFVSLIEKRKTTEVEESLEKYFNSKEKEIYNALDNDLNVSKAVSLFFELLSFYSDEGNLLADCVKLKIFSLIQNMQNIFGVCFIFEDEKIPQEIIDLVESRNTARAEKNWQESDRIRDEIISKGYSVRDSKDGVEILKI